MNCKSHTHTLGYSVEAMAIEQGKPGWCMWAQGGTGRGDGGDGEFDISLEMVLETSRHFLEDNAMQ